MKVLYAARMARPDLLRAVGGLASEVSKWTRASDKKLYKMMCYVHSSKDYVMKGWVQKTAKVSDIFQRLFADAEQGRGDVLENASSTHAGARSLCPTGRNPCTAAVGLSGTLSPGLSRWQWRAASKRVPCWRTVTRAIATVDRCRSSGRSSCTGRTVLYREATKYILQ